MNWVRWTYHSEKQGLGVVIPDGCRDVILETRPGSAPAVFATALDAAPRSIRNFAGQRFTGFRLPPGVLPPDEALREARTLDDCVQILEHSLSRQAETAALTAFLAAPGGSLKAAAAEAGVSPRSLQRHLKAQGSPPPDFWRLLGRARRAAGLLSQGWALADAALEAGYSDQAHMIRAFVRWFGSAPAALCADPALLGNVTQPGLGNWTGEQISTR